MPIFDSDVIVVGAGAAGLAAAKQLDRAGSRVIILEARDRIGGRIFTAHDPLSPVHAELGAEFVHGRSPDVWDIVRRNALTAVDCTGEWILHENGALHHEHLAAEGVDQVMDDVQAAEQDETFTAFLDRSTYPDQTKHWATSYVEGFNAARAGIIGIASLAEDARGAEEIDGDHAFRILNGYDSVALHLREGLENLRLNTIVESIEWQPGSAAVHLRSALDSSRETIRARQVVVTVPLGVLHAGAIRFDPEPRETLAAARALAFGQAVRIVLRFGNAFWEQNKDLANVGFLLSQEPVFPTWWTPRPVHAPIITGWSAGPKADPLLNEDSKTIIGAALASLERITACKPSRLEAAYFHDWHADPFAQGAYSYVPAGALPARRRLAEPVENTLYFAGEATDLNGHSATVHGAIASGKRAAHQILNLP